MTKQEAEDLFLDLVRMYGLQWQANVPKDAWLMMDAVNGKLSADEKRNALNRALNR